MSEPQDQSKAEGQETLALELYKVAFARLNFQDEYLFKFSTVFLTAHGALLAFAGSTYLQRSPPLYGALIALAALGMVLAVAWSLWTRHNDYWHGIWIGARRNLESDHLRTSARVFDSHEGSFARPGQSPPLLRGHAIAQLVPVTFFVAWALLLVLAMCRCLQ